MTKLVPSSAVLERIEAERAHYERRAERIAALIEGQPDRSGVFDSERTWHKEYADGVRYGLDLAASIVRDALRRQLISSWQRQIGKRRRQR